MPISLTDRIRSINRMNGTTRDENVSEQEAEDRLVETIGQAEDIEQSWEDAKLQEQGERTVTDGITLEMVYLELQSLRQTIEEQVDEIKKINKHVNSTQKMLKKAKK